MMKQPYKAITNVPGWAEYLMTGSADKVKSEVGAYNKVPLIRRAVELRCNAIAGIPFEIVGRNGEPVEWQFAVDFSRLLWQTEAAMLLTGAAFWLRAANRLRVLDVQWVNPYTVKVRYNPAADDIVFDQTINGKPVAAWGGDDVVYFREFNPSDDVQPGKSATANALSNAQLMHYATLFSWHFFEGGAMPVMLLGVEGNPPQSDVDRVQQFFKRVATGVKNAFNVIGIRGKITPQIVTPPIKDLAMPKLNAEALRQIAWAFGIPQTMLTDAANYATAKEHRISFYTETIIPRAEQIAAVINEQLFRGRYTLRFLPEQMDIMQTDEAQRAASLLQLVNANLPLKLAMEVLGYDLSEEQWAQVLAGEPEPEPQPSPPDLEQIEATRQLHLEQWERKALNRLKASKSATVEFESDALTAHEQAEIMTGLALCETPAQVSGYFASRG